LEITLGFYINLKFNIQHAGRALYRFIRMQKGLGAAFNAKFAPISAHLNTYSSTKISADFTTGHWTIK
jgi:hypothetical protein